MKIYKKLLLSSLVLGSLTTSTGQAVQAQLQQPVSVEIVGHRANLKYNQGQLPDGGRIQYAIWSEENGQDDLIVYDFQNETTQINLRNHTGYGNYRLATYIITKDQKKQLLYETSFQRLEEGTTTVTQPSTGKDHPTSASSTTNQQVAGTLPAEPNPPANQAKPVETPKTVTTPSTNNKSEVVSSNQGQPLTPNQTTPKAETPANVKLEATYAGSGYIDIKVNQLTGRPHEVTMAIWSSQQGQDGSVAKFSKKSILV